MSMIQSLSRGVKKMEEIEKYRVTLDLYGPSEFEVDELGLMGVLAGRGLSGDVIGEVQEKGSAKRTIEYALRSTGTIVISRAAG
jgi:hypothetical protein